MLVLVDMGRLQRAFTRVRGELDELGILEGYLDDIDCARAALPSLSCLGYVYDEGVPWLPRWFGFKPGTIYIPLAAPFEHRRYGLTLVDTIRHEFAHAWAWLDRRRVDGRWFRFAFGGRYGDEEHRKIREPVHHHFPSDYATTRPAEAFAEVFMTYLRHRRGMTRFRARPGLYKKLLAVEEFIHLTARRLRRRR